MIRGALDGGAAGIVMGRNIWQSQRPLPLIKAVQALIHDDAPLEGAIDILKSEIRVKHRDV
jgi:putative autoinducer-2 (AI-2) aldolase